MCCSCTECVELLRVSCASVRLNSYLSCLGRCRFTKWATPGMAVMAVIIIIIGSVMFLVFIFRIIIYIKASAVVFRSTITVQFLQLYVGTVVLMRCFCCKIFASLQTLGNCYSLIKIFTTASSKNLIIM